MGNTCLNCLWHDIVNDKYWCDKFSIYVNDEYIHVCPYHTPM